MLAFILVGLYVIFIYWRRQSRLYAEQKTFISQITHELKSPLASIRLHLETIRLRKLSADKLEKFLDTMLADTERLDVLISNFLMAAKLEQASLTADFPIIDLSKHLIKYLEAYQETLPEGSSLSLDIEDGIFARADADGINMMLRNLLENAFIYSAGSPEVRVTLRLNNRNCILTVSDNGCGIAKKELKNIFRMFYRVRESGDNIKGTGLGLYIVKSIVKRHRGRIHAESSGEGQGSSFVITIPAVEGK
jgi:signal transduction histidine kinase